MNYDASKDVFGVDLRKNDFSIAIGLFEEKVRANRDTAQRAG